jgi:hypothetical protein
VYDPLLNPTFQGGLWASCPLWEFMHDPAIGVLLDENFVEYDASTGGEYTLTQATAGSAAISTTFPGTLAIDSGSTTATQGANVQRLKSAFVPAANKSLWAEFRVLFTGVGNLNVETFIGLAASDTTIIATSAVSTQNRIGWSSVTDDGVLLFDVDKAGTGTTAAATTIAASTWLRLGFYYDGASDTLVQFINGAAFGNPITTTHIPKVAVFPSLVVQSGGSDQPVLNVGGYRIFQLR